MNNDITNFLFETNAVQVCPEGEPFFYTSGKLGPYYINTHYLYGSKSDAEKFLNDMEHWKTNLNEFPALMFEAAKKQYLENTIYKKVIEMVCKKASDLTFDYISGGERRDFFFSILPAFILDKPHLSIMKDGTAIVSNPKFTESYIVSENETAIQMNRHIDLLDLTDKKILHIADLVTEASSYVRAWIPVINRLGAEITDTIAIVDRKQGGRHILADMNVRLHSFAEINEKLFDDALDLNHINLSQYNMIIDFIENPDKFMVSFLKNNPDFLQNQINLGGKAKERALRCIENNFDKE